MSISDHISKYFIIIARCRYYKKYFQTNKKLIISYNITLAFKTCILTRDYNQSSERLFDTITILYIFSYDNACAPLFFFLV